MGVMERSTAAGHSASELAVQNPGNGRLGGRAASLEQAVQWEFIYNHNRPEFIWCGLHIGVGGREWLRATSFLGTTVICPATCSALPFVPFCPSFCFILSIPFCRCQPRVPASFGGQM